MPLPSAVKRNAEKARQSVAASKGVTSSSPAPQKTDGEFLNVGSGPSQQSTQTTQVAHVSADTLAESSATEQSSQQASSNIGIADGTHRPHILSDDALPMNDAAQQTNGSTSQTLSHTDSADGGANSQRADFIDENDWKARYTALRTSRDARVSDLEREVSQLKTTNEQLVQQATVLDAPADNRFTLDDETRANLGEDQAKVFDRFNDSVEQRFAQQETEQKQTNDLAVQRFESDLESLVPRWKKINVEQGWFDWLAQPDEVLGVRRQDMLDGFVRDRDAGSVAALFRSYAASGGQGHQRNGHSPSPELSAARAGSGLGAEENMVEIWSQSEIADFFQAKSRLYQSGKLKGAKLEEVMAEEAIIRKAMDERRVDMTA